MNKKECGTCTKCCEGTLKLIVHGKKVSNGIPCHLLSINSGCSDYENRPAMPCRVYKCIWLKNKSIPENFKPNNVNFIIHRMWMKSNEYYTLIPAGEKIDVADIDNIFQWFKNNQSNFLYTHNENEYVCGDEQFLKECYNNKDLRGKDNDK